MLLGYAIIACPLVLTTVKEDYDETISTVKSTCRRCFRKEHFKHSNFCCDCGTALRQKTSPVSRKKGNVQKKEKGASFVGRGARRSIKLQPLLTERRTIFQPSSNLSENSPVLLPVNSSDFQSIPL